MREDAQEAFFFFFFNAESVHHCPDRWVWQTGTTVLDRVEAPTSLQDIIPATFYPAYDFWRLSFSPVDEEYTTLCYNALQGWEKTIDDIKDKLDLPNLTLRVYFADFYDASYATQLWKKITRKEGITRVACVYARITSPLEKSKASGFSRLFVHAAWPWYWTMEGRDTRI